MGSFAYSRTLPPWVKLLVSPLVESLFIPQ